MIPVAVTLKYYLIWMVHFKITRIAFKKLICKFNKALISVYYTQYKNFKVIVECEVNVESNSLETSRFCIFILIL